MEVASEESFIAFLPSVVSLCCHGFPVALFAKLFVGQNICPEE
jgi:hypothetical protein